MLFVGTAIWPYFLGLMLILAAVFWAHDLLGRPKRPFRDELSYRCGTAPLSRYVEAAQAALDRHEADWVLLFTMAALPHGDRRWLQLELREGPPPSGEAELRISHPEQATFVRADKELTVDIAQELWTLLKDLERDEADRHPGLRQRWRTLPARRAAPRAPARRLGKLQYRRVACGAPPASNRDFLLQACRHRASQLLARMTTLAEIRKKRMLAGISTH